jgi:hypothetical protein
VAVFLQRPQRLAEHDTVKIGQQDVVENRVDPSSNNHALKSDEASLRDVRVFPQRPQRLADHHRF